MNHETPTDETTTDAGTESPERGGTTRRRIIAASAVLGAGAAGIPSMTAASGDESDEHRQDGEKSDDETMADEPPTAVPNEFQNDVEILNYALTLEYLEAEFYKRGIRNIADDLLAREFGDEGAAGDHVPDRLRVIRDHEITHAEALDETITMLGGEPVAQPEFDFGMAVKRPAEFVATGAILEDVGVSAYAGAAPHIENADLVPPALGIHSVEARHASFLRELDDQIGFPMAFDQPRSRSEVLELAGGFIVG